MKARTKKPLDQRRTPQKMQEYLDRLELTGMTIVRAVVPKEMADEMLLGIEAGKAKYLHNVLKTAQDGDARIAALAKGNLAQKMTIPEYKHLDKSTPDTHQWEFKRRAALMHDAWDDLTSAIQAKDRIAIRGDNAEMLRAEATAVVYAMSYRAARDALVRFVTSIK